MYVIRPITENELDDLERFAYGTSLGMLSLPKDRELLKGKIAHSMESFKREVSYPKD